MKCRNTTTRVATCKYNTAS